jgi:hypothetical protein
MATRRPTEQGTQSAEGRPRNFVEAVKQADTPAKVIPCRVPWYYKQMFAIVGAG